MSRRVVAYVGARHDLYHTSRLLTGLCALHARGEVALRYARPDPGDEWLSGDPVVMCLDVHDTSARRRVAIDLRDGVGLSRPIVDNVDVYLKRAFSGSETAALPIALARKMQPFGLNYGCRSVESTIRLLRSVGWGLAGRGRAGINRLRQYLSTPGPRAFEQSPDAPVEPKVMFQTRLWTSEEVAAGEAAPLNEGRVAMVRALRRAFGDRFVGGLVPTPYAVANYPNDVTPHSARYSRYLALKKRCLISIYTRGVEHSLAFKLGETIAASQCLVSVPLRYELPSPLVAGQNYLPAETPEDAVDACERLLSDPTLAARMRHANHRYYVSEVEPAAHAARVLDRIASS